MFGNVPLPELAWHEVEQGLHMVPEMHKDSKYSKALQVQKTSSY